MNTKVSKKVFAIISQPALKNSITSDPKQFKTKVTTLFETNQIAEQTAKEAVEAITVSINKSIEEASKEAVKRLPKETISWIKLFFKEKVTNIKNKTYRYFENLHSKKTSNNRIHNESKQLKNIPDELKRVFENLKGKTGQEFIDSAYQSMTEHMNLINIAPKSVIIKGEDGLMNITGGYNPITNTIEYSKGFLEKLSSIQQINLISHELKHCEQFTNMIRTDGIGISEYANAIAENTVRNAIKNTSLDNLIFRMQYKKALENGQGEEFIQNAIQHTKEKINSQIEKNFAEVLKMPKIKADSPEGIKAFEHLEAERNYEGLNFLGFGGENYKNNPLEIEAYAYGEKISNLYKNFIS